MLYKIHIKIRHKLIKFCCKKQNEKYNNLRKTKTNDLLNLIREYFKNTIAKRRILKQYNKFRDNKIKFINERINEINEKINELNKIKIKKFNNHYINNLLLSHSILFVSIENDYIDLKKYLKNTNKFVKYDLIIQFNQIKSSYLINIFLRDEKTYYNFIKKIQNITEDIKETNFEITNLNNDIKCNNATIKLKNDLLNDFNKYKKQILKINKNKLNIENQLNEIEKLFLNFNGFRKQNKIEELYDKLNDLETKIEIINELYEKLNNVKTKKNKIRY